MNQLMLRTAGLALALAVTAPLCAAPAGAAASWSPAASERLIKLPGQHLKRAVDNDFAGSALAAALYDTEEQLRLKTQTLADLRAAIDRSEGDLRIELEHEFLAEKRRYIELMSEHQDLRRERAETKVRLYETLLRRLNRDRRSVTPAQAQLIANQASARARMDATVAEVDREMLRSTAATRSRYAQDYAKNLAAIESLTAAIQSHPMNQAPEIAGQPVTQADYLRQLLANNEAELAIVDQEQAVIGHMARLVALDALALAEGIGGDDPVEAAYGEADAYDPVTSAVDFFATQ